MSDLLNNDHMKPRFPERLQDVEAEHVRPVLTQILDTLLRIEALLGAREAQEKLADMPRGNYEDRVTPKTPEKTAPAEKPKATAKKNSRW